MKGNQVLACFMGRVYVKLKCWTILELGEICIYCRKIDCRAINRISKDFIPTFTRFRNRFFFLAVSMMMVPMIMTFMTVPHHFLAGLVWIKICAAAKSSSNRQDKNKGNKGY